MIRPAGDRASLIEVPDNASAVRLARLLRVERPDLVDVVVGHTTVLVTWPDEVADLGELRIAFEPEPGGRPIEIPVVYDGPDLDEVAQLTGLSPEEVVARHTGVEHVAAFLGFQPGFAYLTGGDERLRVPRREVPRTHVPGGTVAIAGPYSGIYPRASPGGWRLLGSTTAVLFDPTQEPPALLAPGDRVLFVVA
ncbi:MAG TPA: 5-oxoprolinase subunit PxpB [Gaiellaceae bacterium]|nr:5-oxoprolinase subunit PxpB [Gaiellaceae bacterium]